MTNGGFWTGVWSGVAKGSAIALSALPFGMAFGLVAVNAGLSVFEAATMSVTIFAGASQIAAVQLAASDAPGILVVAIAAGINLRFVLYAAKFAPILRRVKWPVRLALAYLMTDQAFAVVNAEITGDRPPDRPVAFYLGVSLSLWIAWQIGTVLGAGFGASVDSGLGLDFAAPLVFVALSAMSIRSRADVWSAVTSVAVIIALKWLPFGLGLLPAIVAGMAVGWMARPR